MSDAIKETKITIKGDRATGIATTYTGANFNGMAFNLSYIMEKSPVLTKQIMELYEKARVLEKLESLL